MFDRTRGGVLNVNLALGQAFEQLVGRKIDQHNLIGVLEYPIRDGFADPNAGNLLDNVVEALQMLDVEGGPDVNAGGEQFLDVLPSLGMATPGYIGVGKFVNQEQARMSRQGGIKVEFIDDQVAIDDRFAGEDLEARKQRLRFLPAMRLDDANDHVAAFLLDGPRGGQHPVGLADPGSCP